MTNARSHAWVQAAATEHGPALLRYARSLCHDPDLAADAVQETFLRLMKEDRAKLEDRLLPWLFRVCRSRLTDHHRKFQRMSSLDDTTLAHTAAPDIRPDVAAEQADAARRVFARLDELPPRQREAVRLKFQNGLSYKEIADVMTNSVGNVGFLLHSALNTLRDRLAADLPSLSERSS